MKLIAIFFQYCSMKVFEPLNVYEKCKVFMCSMRCSDNRAELLCMIESLNEILSNKETQKELRIVLLKEHLSYLLKLTSSTNQPNSHFVLKNTKEAFDLIKSLLDLLESMVNLMSEENKEQETLTIYIHILAQYLSDSAADFKLNDLVLKKLLNLGTNHKQEFKLILNKWPDIKLKIENAFKTSQQTNQQQMNASQTNMTSSANNKAPKIQLKTKFGYFKQLKICSFLLFNFFFGSKKWKAFQKFKETFYFEEIKDYLLLISTAKTFYKKC